MAGGEQRSISGDGAVVELLWLLLCSRAEEEEREERATERVEWPGGRGAASRPGEGGRPRRVQRQRTAATWPAPGGVRRALRAGERGEGKRATLSGWAERETGRPSSACPLSLFFEFLFSNSF